MKTIDSIMNISKKNYVERLLHLEPEDCKTEFKRLKIVQNEGKIAKLNLNTTKVIPN